MSFTDTVPVQGKEISYKVIGDLHHKDTAGTIVLVHGAMGNSVTLELLAEELHRLLPDRSVVLIDLPGHGKSPGPAETEIREMSEYVEKFIEYMRATGCYGSRIDLVGHSMGGSVCFCAVDTGLEVESLSLLMSAGSWESMSGLLDFPEEQIVPTFHAMMEAEFAGLENEQELKAMIESMAASGEAGKADIKALASFNVLDKVHNLKVPTLLVAAEKDTTATPEAVEELASKIQGSQYQLLENGTHTSVIGKATEVAMKLAYFVR